MRQTAHGSNDIVVHQQHIDGFRGREGVQVRIRRRGDRPCWLCRRLQPTPSRRSDAGRRCTHRGKAGASLAALIAAVADVGTRQGSAPLRPGQVGSREKDQGPWMSGRRSERCLTRMGDAWRPCTMGWRHADRLELTTAAARVEAEASRCSRLRSPGRGPWGWARTGCLAGCPAQRRRGG